MDRKIINLYLNKIKTCKKELYYKSIIAMTDMTSKSEWCNFMIQIFNFGHLDRIWRDKQSNRKLLIVKSDNIMRFCYLLILGRTTGLCGKTTEHFKRIHGSEACDKLFHKL